MLPPFYAAALNHLLSQNDWAPTRLARFAGKTARFDIAPFSFAYTILADGMLRSADTSATADVICTIAPSLLPRLALRDEKAQADIMTEGDAALLAEVFFLMHNLHWDAAKDLSRIAGDAMAESFVRTAREARRRFHDAATNLSRMVATYCTDEHPLLARPQQAADFMQQVITLCDDVARLEQRIKRLATAQGH